MDDLTETYCLMDDFYKAFEPQLNARLLTDGKHGGVMANTAGSPISRPLSIG